MGKFEIIIGCTILVLIALIVAVCAWYPSSAYDQLIPIPGNESCWLNLCVEEGVNTNCIRFPLSYENCGTLEYTCVGIVEYRDRFNPESLTWQDLLEFECTFYNETCWCVKEGGL